MRTSAQFHGNGDKLPVHKQSTEQQSASFDKNSINMIKIYRLATNIWIIIRYIHESFSYLSITGGTARISERGAEKRHSSLRSTPARYDIITLDKRCDNTIDMLNY